LLERALKLSKERKFVQAEMALSESIAFDSNNAHALNLRGLIFFEKRDVRNALKDWKTSLSIKKENNPAQFYLNECVDSSAIINNAREQFNHAIDAVRKGLDLNIGASLLNRAVSIDPRFIDAWKLLGLLRGELGEYGKARKCWLEVLKINCEDYEAIRYLNTVGVSLIRPTRNALRFTGWFFSVSVFLALIAISFFYYHEQNAFKRQQGWYVKQIEDHERMINVKADEITTLKKKNMAWNNKNIELETQYRLAIQERGRLKETYDKRIDNLEKQYLDLQKKNESAKAKIKTLENEISRSAKADTPISEETKAERMDR